MQLMALTLETPDIQNQNLLRLKEGEVLLAQGKFLAAQPLLFQAYDYFKKTAMDENLGKAAYHYGLNLMELEKFSRGRRMF